MLLLQLASSHPLGLLSAFQAKLLLTGRYRGFRIGPYVVRDQIGQGGMGTVYLAEHGTLRRRVAIKVLAAAESRRHLAVERFQREARAAAALDHPNIVRIFDVARHNDTPYLVMEYVDGVTLQEVLDRDGSVPYTAAADYVKDHLPPTATVMTNAALQGYNTAYLYAAGIFAVGFLMSILLFRRRRPATVPAHSPATAAHVPAPAAAGA